MAALFRHTPLAGAPWSDAAALAAIRAIVADALANWSPQALWPLHPLDDMPPHITVPNTGLYDGAAGVIWACRHLPAAGVVDDAGDFGGLTSVGTAMPRSRSAPARPHRSSSATAARCCCSPLWRPTPQSTIASTR